MSSCPLCFRRRGKSRRKLREAVISDETEVEETGTETENTEADERGAGDEVASHIQVKSMVNIRRDVYSLLVTGSAPEVWRQLAEQWS